MPGIGDINHSIETAKEPLKGGIQSAGSAEIHRLQAARLVGELIAILSQVNTAPIAEALKDTSGSIQASAASFAVTRSILQEIGTDNRTVRLAASELDKSHEALKGPDGVCDALALLGDDITDIQGRVIGLASKLEVVQTWLTDTQRGIATAAAGGINANFHLTSYQQNLGT